MIITIDGPAGAGKSTVARQLARRLGFQFLNTGAMYRSVALAALGRGIAWSETGRIAELTAEIDLALDGDHVLLDGEDVTQAIRTSEITAVVGQVADNTEVRRRLIELQRRLAADGDFVTEGRDQGTLAFPDAECKFFLTASPEERAKRRVADQAARGESVSYDAVLAAQEQRDADDARREFGRLEPAPDSIFFNTDGLAIEEVAAGLEAEVRRRLGSLRPQRTPQTARIASGGK